MRARNVLAATLGWLILFALLWGGLTFTGG